MKSRIIEGLKDAVRHARGNKVHGISDFMTKAQVARYIRDLPAMEFLKLVDEPVPKPFRDGGPGLGDLWRKRDLDAWIAETMKRKTCA